MQLNVHAWYNEVEVVFDSAAGDLERTVSLALAARPYRGYAAYAVVITVQL